MEEEADRPRTVERVEQAQTPEEARRRRSNNMIGIGVIALVWGLITTAMGGNPATLVLALLGIGLLVGGLVIRR